MQVIAFFQGVTITNFSLCLITSWKSTFAAIFSTMRKHGS